MRRLIIPVGLLAGMSANTQAFAQSTAENTEGTLEEVIVTAERREQTLQETALTVSVVSGKEIARTGLSTFNDVLERAPGVQMQFQPTPSNGPTIAIRGIGTDAIPNKQSATAIYEDGIRSYRLDNYFYDIARVEVLKGPQGTLYGGTATGGAVSVISNDPTLGEFEGSASAEAGNYNLRHMQGMLNVPASDTLSFRLAGNWQTRDQYSGSDDPKGQDSLNFRGKALWQPNDDFSLLAGAEYYRDKGLGRNSMTYVDANANLDEMFAKQVGHNFIEVEKYFLNLNLDVGIGRLTYIPAVQYAELDQVYLSSPMTDDAMPDGKLVTHELRLASDADSFISWVAGAYYYDEKSINVTTIGTPLGDIVSIDDNHNRQVAGFGQATIPLSDTWRFTGGLRYSDDEVVHPQTQTYPPAFGIPGGTTPFAQNFHHLDYLARVEHDLTPDNLLYSSLSTGYRPGNLAVNGQAYGNETVKAHEIGSKNTLLDGSLVLNAAVFYYKYDGFQIANDESCGPGCLTFGMASVPADFVGGELDLTWRLTPNDTLVVQPSYLKARFTDDFLARQSIFDPYTPVTADGDTIPHAPEWRLNANYQHDFILANDSRVFVRGEAAYVTEQFTDFSACVYAAPGSATCGGAGGDNVANHTQDDYTLVNLSAGYSAPDDRWSVTAYVRNLTDEIYKLNYTRVAGAVFVGAPRTYGVVVSTKW